MKSLTSEFGMGSGISSSPVPPEKMCQIIESYIHVQKTTLEIFFKLISLAAVTDLLSITTQDAGNEQLKKKGQANGLISIGQLNVLLRLHLQPINHVIFMESHRDT